MTHSFQTQNSPRLRVGVKPPPRGAVEGCSCQVHERAIGSPFVKPINPLLMQCFACETFEATR